MRVDLLQSLERFVRTSDPQTSSMTSSPDPLWYKDAVIYQMHVKAFHDANGDGIGDFAGLAQKLDYIQELGVNTIWLLPFYPSPLRDDGYDIAGYCEVHPDYGTLEDFRNFIEEAHRRGLKVITELVINHTSDQHPWFQAARRAPAGSAERDFYVWSDSDAKFAGTRIIFTDTESSNWAWDPVARQYYWHRFFSHQPDLNHNNPQVVDAVIEVMRFWLDMGVDGMRLDAIPYLCVREGTNNENLPETHAVLKRMRAVVDAHYTGRMFLAEANQWPEDVREYFGDGDECHVAYHFPLMPRIFMAVALEDRYPIAEILRQTPDIPENCQWAIFLRNHDELTLEMVTDRERDYMYRMYAQEPRMRVNVGIRRRLAPLLHNDLDRIKLMNSLLLSMPGSPIIYYGDEIGMGDNIYIGDRNGVRTPMQWSIDRNAGFSRADPQRLYLPVIMDPVYGYQAVNVEAQSRDASSLLNWTRRVLAVRRQYRCFGRGTLDFVRPKNRKVLAYVRTCGEQVVLCVANLSQTAQAVELDLATYRGRVPVELMGRNSFPPIGELPYFLTLAGHGFFWLLLSCTEAAPAWHVERLPAAELPVLVLSDGLNTLVPGQAGAGERSVARRTVQQLQQEVLPEFLAHCGWFSKQVCPLVRVTLAQAMHWRLQSSTALLAFFAVDCADGAQQRYFLPLLLAWEDQSGSALHTGEWTLAKVREHARVGVLVDAFADTAFCLALLESFDQQAQHQIAGHCLRFARTAAYALVQRKSVEPVQLIRPDVRTTQVIFGERFVLRVFRRAEPGTNPAVEVTEFLTSHGYRNVAALVGTAQWLDDAADERPVTLMALFEHVGDQGDAWTYTLNHLERHLNSLLSDGRVDAEQPHSLFNSQMRTLGRRVGQLHAVLASDASDAAFAPQAVTPAILQQWGDELLARVEQTLDTLQQQLDTLTLPAHRLARQVLLQRAALSARVSHVRPAPAHARYTRYHGNLQLTEVLLRADDFLISGFEGGPGYAPADCRCKHSPLRDVASVLRSLDLGRAAAMQRAPAAGPEWRERAEAALLTWRDQASAAFLEGYDTQFDELLQPQARAERQQLLPLFLIERTLHELQEALAAGRPHCEATLAALVELAA
jgi:maltose alpha-D-glucosyltransferase/alpha-amylase